MHLISLLVLAADSAPAVPDSVVGVGTGLGVIGTLAWFLKRFTDGSLDNQREQTVAMREQTAAMREQTTALREVLAGFQALNLSLREHMSDNERNIQAVLGKIKCPA